ncbi:MAG: hypothetical protein RIS47_883 [Bacteroidota bacterium]
MVAFIPNSYKLQFQKKQRTSKSSIPATTNPKSTRKSSQKTRQTPFEKNKDKEL